MFQPTLLLIRMYLALTAPRERDERGDVPGWVLITVMTAAIVITLWAFAEDELKQMLQTALNKVGKKA